MLKISDAEFEVLKVIWENGEITSNDIIKEMRDYPWNCNTIRTLIKRLHTKGAIEIIGKKGKAYCYRATLNEEKYKNELTLDLLKKFYNGSFNEFIFEYCKDTEELKEVGKIMKSIIDKME